MKLQEFKIRMLAKIKPNLKPPDVSNKRHEDSLFFKLKKKYVRQPRYSTEVIQQNSISNESIIIPLILGKKYLRHLLADFHNLSAETEGDFFKLFKQQLFLGLYQESLETIEKCLLFNKCKYLKWKCLAQYFIGTLNEEILSKCISEDWKIEANMLNIYLTNSDEKAKELLQINEYYGGIAWIRIYSVSNALDKRKIKISILRRLVEKYPNNNEAYFLLIKLLLSDKKKEGQVLCESALLRFGNLSDELIVFIVINYSKFLVIDEKYRIGLELLQENFKKHSKFQDLLYYYGKFSVKWKISNQISSGISALQEYIRYNNTNKALFWLVEGYLITLQIRKMLKILLKLNPENFSRKKQSRLEAISNQFNKEINIINSINQNPSLDILSDTNEIKKFCQFLYLKTENEDVKTLKVLRECQLLINYDLSYAFKELNFLYLINDPDYPIKCNDLTDMIKEPKITAKHWSKALIIYANYLTTIRQYEDAITILKCIGRIFPKYPFDLPYISKINEIHQGSSIADFHLGFSSLHLKNEPRKESQDIVSNIAERLSISKRRYTVQAPKGKINTNIPSIKDTNFIDDSKHNQNDKHTYEYTWLFYTISPLFLYKIGKYSAKYKVKELEGIMALQDFEEFSKKNKSSVSEKKNFYCRSRYYLLVLYKNTKQDNLFESLKSVVKGIQEFKEFSSKTRLIEI